MSAFASWFSAWAINEVLLTSGAYLIYLWLRHLSIRAGDRYLFLKVSFLSLPVLPLFSYLNGLLFHRSRLESIRVSGEINGTALLPLSAFHPDSAWVGLILGWLVFGALAAYLILFLKRVLAIAGSMFRLQKVRKTGRVVSQAHEIPVLVHKVDMPPATMGVLSPVVLISERTYQAFSESELRLVVAHEKQHIWRHDSFFNLVRHFVDAVLLFCPAMKRLSDAFEEEMELSCDELLLDDPAFNKRAYSRLLVELSASSNFSPIQVCSGFFNSKPFILRRIEAMKFQSLFRTRQSLILALSLSFSVASIWTVGALALDTKTKVQLPNLVVSSDIKLPDYCAGNRCSSEFEDVYPKAVQGDDSAQNQIGEMLLFGSGAPQDYREARGWFLKSSEQGNAVAPNHLGRLYLNGEGVLKDSAEACKWYKISAERGDDAGKHNARICRDWKTETPAPSPQQWPARK